MAKYTYLPTYLPASRSVLVPFQWYMYPKKCPKKLLTFFPCIFYGKTKWNSLQIPRNKISSSYIKYSSLNVSNIPNGVERGQGVGIAGPYTLKL